MQRSWRSRKTIQNKRNAPENWTNDKQKQDVQQGCVLSSSLFTLYTAKIFKEVQDVKGVTIGGINLNNLRYADDLHDLLNAVNKAGKLYEMEMNIIKTKAMVVSKTTPAPKINITLEGKSVQQTDKMISLGSLLTEDGKCEKEIKRRIELARSGFKNVKGTNFKNYHHTNKKRSITMLQMVKVTLWFRDMDIDKGNSKQTRSIWNVDIWRMVRISWTEHKSNEEVLEITISKRSLIATVKERKLQYFGHLIRQNGIQRLLLEGKIEGMIGHGRPKTMWMDNIQDQTGLNMDSVCVKSQRPDRMEIHDSQPTESRWHMIMMIKVGTFWCHPQWCAPGYWMWGRCDDLEGSTG